MRNRQKGVTFLGWMVLLLPFAVMFYAGIRLTPIYLTYTKVSRTLTQMSHEFSGDAQVSAGALRVSLDKRLDIEGIDYPTADNITFVREDGVWVGEAKYEDEVPLFGDLFLVVKFDKVVPFK
jgi:hypothetical protein